jgi:hypothetical protein
MQSGICFIRTFVPLGPVAKAIQNQRAAAPVLACSRANSSPKSVPW